MLEKIKEITADSLGADVNTLTAETSFKEDLEEVFDEMGLGWAAGIRFALKEFYKKYSTK